MDRLQLDGTTYKLPRLLKEQNKNKNTSFCVPVLLRRNLYISQVRAETAFAYRAVHLYSMEENQLLTQR